MVSAHLRHEKRSQHDNCSQHNDVMLESKHQNFSCNNQAINSMDLTKIIARGKQRLIFSKAPFDLEQ